MKSRFYAFYYAMLVTVHIIMMFKFPPSTHFLVQADNCIYKKKKNTIKLPVSFLKSYI